MKKVLVITGASRDIGLATARLFAAEGYEIITLSRQQPELESISHLSVDLSDINWVADNADTLENLICDAGHIDLLESVAKLQTSCSIATVHTA